MGDPRPAVFVLNERDLANPRAGGAEVNVFETYGRLAARGWPVTLVCADYPGSEGPRSTVRGLDVHRVGNRYTFYGRGPAAFRRLARTVRSPAVLVENLCKLPFYGPLYSPFPVVGLVHHLFGTTAFRQVNLPVATATWLSELGMPLAYARTPLIAVSPSTRDDLIARGFAAERITVITNGLDHERYAPDGSDPEPLIVAVGRIEPYKRLDLVIDAMPRIRAAVPGARLVVAGRGDELPALARRAEALRVADAVELRGFVTEEEKVALYRRARLLVNPSEKEGWGLTVLEANACGTPAVAADVPGLRDAVRHDETGLLVPYGDLQAWTRAIIAVLHDDATWRRLRAGALAWSARFTWDAVADQTAALLMRVVAAAESPVAAEGPVARDAGRRA